MTILVRSLFIRCYWGQVSSHPPFFVLALIWIEAKDHLFWSHRDRKSGRCGETKRGLCFSLNYFPDVRTFFIGSLVPSPPDPEADRTKIEIRWWFERSWCAIESRRRETKRRLWWWGSEGKKLLRDDRTKRREVSLLSSLLYGTRDAERKESRFQWEDFNDVEEREVWCRSLLEKNFYETEGERNKRNFSDGSKR